MTDTDDLVERQVYMLRRQCFWQRSQGTDLDNGYPYHKHLPDCDICRSAELIESDRERIKELEREQTAWRKFTDEANSTLDKADAENESLRAQNKRYREALETVALGKLQQVGGKLVPFSEYAAEQLKEDEWRNIDVPT